MTLPFLPDVPKIDPEKGPNLFAGATSPLWLIFGGAAMAGATWWWWSARWREAVNLEAIMGAAPTSDLVFDPVVEAPVVAPAAVEALEAPALAAVAAVEAVVDATQEVLETVGAVAVEAIESVETTLPPANDAAETIEAAPEEIEPVADDLTLLVGIGPKLAASLAELGVTRFAQIAAWGAKELADFDTKLSLKGRAERDAWVAQAKRLAAG